MQITKSKLRRFVIEELQIFNEQNEQVVGGVETAPSAGDEEYERRTAVFRQPKAPAMFDIETPKEDYSKRPLGVGDAPIKTSSPLDAAKGAVKNIKDLGLGVSYGGTGWHQKVPKAKRVGPAMHTGISYTKKFGEQKIPRLQQIIREELQAVINEQKFRKLSDPSDRLSERGDGHGNRIWPTTKKDHPTRTRSDPWTIKVNGKSVQPPGAKNNRTSWTNKEFAIWYREQVGTHGKLPEGIAISREYRWPPDSPGLGKSERKRRNAVYTGQDFERIDVTEDFKIEGGKDTEEEEDESLFKDEEFEDLEDEEGEEGEIEFEPQVFNVPKPSGIGADTEAERLLAKAAQVAPPATAACPEGQEQIGTLNDGSPMCGPVYSRQQVAPQTPADLVAREEIRPQQSDRARDWPG